MYAEVYYGDGSGSRRYMLQSDSIWSFDDQYSKRLPAAGRLLQNGDFIQVMCVFDSTARDKPTIFGPATTDEMCWHQLDYYPEQPNVTCAGPKWLGVLPAGAAVDDIRHMLPQPATSLPNDPAKLGVNIAGALCLADEMNALEPQVDSFTASLMGACSPGENPPSADCLILISSIIGCGCKCNAGYDKLDAVHAEMVSTVYPLLLGMMGPILNGYECPNVCPDRPAPPIFAASLPAPPYVPPATSLPSTATMSAPTTPVVARSSTPTSMPLTTAGLSAPAATNKPSTAATTNMPMSVAVTAVCRLPLFSLLATALCMLVVCWFG